MCPVRQPHHRKHLTHRPRASGRHGFAVRRSHRSCARRFRSRLPALRSHSRRCGPASAAVRPAFVTIAIRPSSLGRVAATHTPFPNFGKVEYFWPRGLTDRLGVLPVGQRQGLWLGQAAEQAPVSRLHVEFPTERRNTTTKPEPSSIYNPHAPGGDGGEMSSRPDEREQVRVEDIRMCGQHAMRVARISLQRPFLKQINGTRH